MEEKKLNDEKIVKAVEICYNSPGCTADCPYFNKHGRNFCVEEKAFYKDLKRIVTEHAEQKAEIKRLTEENGRISQSYIEVCDINAELQQQADELAKQLEKCKKNKAWAVTKELAEEIKKQAVKDTAKEILPRIYNSFSLYYPHGQIPYSVFQERLKRLAESKGVEVE